MDAASHLSDEDLERYVTGMVHQDAELAWIEKHLFVCDACTHRMWALQDGLDATQAGLRLDDEETSRPL
jgi:anti-sigma factor RsiW